MDLAELVVSVAVFGAAALRALWLGIGRLNAWLDQHGCGDG